MGIYNKTGKEILFDLINEANPRETPFSTANSTVESYTAGNFTVGGKTYNTSARIRGLPGSGYVGIQVVYYNRLNLATLFQNVFAGLDSYSAASIHGALPNLNGRYGLKLTNSDVADTAIGQPNVSNATGNVTMVAAAGSPFLVPATSVVIRYNRGLPKLDAFVVNTSLTAYEHPVFDDSRLSAQMLTYGLDLTEYKNLLLVDGTGMPNFAALSQVLTTVFGLPVWDAPINSNYVTDGPTSSVSLANKQYDRVVTQTGISNGQVVGFAYYHYMS